MGTTKEQYATPDPLLSPGTKDFLEGFGLGRCGLRAGRAARQLLRSIRNPIQQKIWVGQCFFPLRNMVLGNRPVTIPLGDISVQMVPEGSVARDTWTGLRSDRQEVCFLLSVIEPGCIFFDIGANAGLFAVCAAKKIGESGVFAFEPRSATCKLLKRNLALNGVADVHVSPTALGDLVGQGVLQVDVRGNSALNNSAQEGHPGNSAERPEKVCFNTLDAFVNEHSTSRIDVIRADIAGAELMLFHGAKDLLLRSDAPMILYKSLGFRTRGFGYHPVETLWFLESCGFELFTLNSDSDEFEKLKPDFQYNSMVIAAKPSHAGYAKLQARIQ